jgi:hypothetical protein
MKPVKLEPNKPVTLALLDPYADSCELYDQERGVGEYRTTDGRILALPRQAAIALNELDPKPGEEIGICRYTGKSARVAVWLTASSEKARAEAGTAQDEAEAPTATPSTRKDGNGPFALPALTREHVKRHQAGMNPPSIQEMMAPRGTGTHGPAPLPAPMPAKQPRPAIAARTPYGQMLRHIIRTTKNALAAENVALGDGAFQDIVSTLYIDAARRSGVEYDFTDGGVR